MLNVVFCNLDETILHIFYDCHIAKFIWSVVQVSFNIVVRDFKCTTFDSSPFEIFTLISQNADFAKP